MDISSISAASIDMHMAQAQQEAGVAVTKKAMDFQENQAAQLIASIQASNPAPSFGHTLDVLV